MYVGCNEQFCSHIDYNVHLKRAKACFLKVEYDQGDPGKPGVEAGDDLETAPGNMEHGLELTEQPIDVDGNYGETESADFDAMGSESGTVSIESDAEWELFSDRNEDDDNSYFGANYYRSSSAIVVRPTMTNINHHT